MLDYITKNRLEPKPHEAISKQAAQPIAASQASAAASPKPVSPPVTFVSPSTYNEHEEYIDIELTGMRKAIAKRLTQSKVCIG